MSKDKASKQNTNRSQEFAAPEDAACRVPPQNIHAEQGLLGSLLLLNDAIDAINLKPEHFYSIAHGEIYRAIREMWAAGTRAIDGVTLASELLRREKLQEIGGPAYIGELLETVPHAAHARYYADLIFTSYKQRTLIGVTTEILRDAYGTLHGDEVDQIIATAEQQIHEVKIATANDDAQSFSHMLTQSLERIEYRQKEGGTGGGVSTGFVDVDSQLGYMQGGEMIVVAAAPSMGKTAFTCNVAQHVAKEHGSVLFVSLEMTRLELTDRLLAMHSGVNSLDIRTGNLSPEDGDKLMQAANEMNDLPLLIKDQPSQSMSYISGIARREHRQGKLALIIIDYLQLIEPENRRDPREQQVAQMSRAVKVLAKELNIPIMVLGQLNRKLNERTDKIPRLGDLRESSAIEQDADVVAFLHRPEYYNPEDNPGLAQLIIGKGRSSGTGTVKLSWQKECMRFQDFSPMLEFDDSFVVRR